MPKFAIREKDGLYLIVDEYVEGSCYGKFKNRRHAEEILKDWIGYFES